jgi:hypothetical protein
VLWLPVGADFEFRRGRDGTMLRTRTVEEFGAAPLIRRSWREDSVLMLHPLGQAHSVWWFFLEGRSRALSRQPQSGRQGTGSLPSPKLARSPSTERDATSGLGRTGRCHACHSQLAAWDTRRAGCCKAVGLRQMRSGDLAWPQPPISLATRVFEPAVDAAKGTLVHLGVMDSECAARVNGAQKVDRFGRLQPRGLHRHKQRLDRLIWHVQRIAWVVEQAIADQVPEVDAVRLAVVHGGVTPADRPYRNAARIEGLSQLRIDDSEATDTGTCRGVHRDAEPGQSQLVYVVGVLVRDQDCVTSVQR